jgi:hypothetical protein
VGLQPKSTDATGGRLNLIVKYTPDYTDLDVNTVFMVTAYKEEEEPQSASKIEFVYAIEHPIIVYA